MSFKTMILVGIAIIIILLAALYLLFQQPGPSYRAASPSLLLQEAAVGRAVIAASRRDPAMSIAVRAAIQAAPDQDRALAADLIATFPEHQK